MAHGAFSDASRSLRSLGQTLRQSRLDKEQSGQRRLQNAIARAEIRAKGFDIDEDFNITRTDVQPTLTPSQQISRFKATQQFGADPLTGEEVTKFDPITGQQQLFEPKFGFAGGDQLFNTIAKQIQEQQTGGRALTLGGQPQLTGQTQGRRPLQFNSLEEADAANLPIGTKLLIRGRPAVVE